MVRGLTRKTNTGIHTYRHLHTCTHTLSAKFSISLVIKKVILVSPPLSRFSGWSNLCSLPPLCSREWLLHVSVGTSLLCAVWLAYTFFLLIYVRTVYENVLFLLQPDWLLISYLSVLYILLGSIMPHNTLASFVQTAIIDRGCMYSCMCILV